MKPNEILGVAPGASIKEARAAYYRKAKELHPDVSARPDAHEAFIEVSAAYETIIRSKTGRVFDDRKQQFTPSPRQSERTREERDAHWRAEVRKRAAAHAKMQYEAFRRSKYYQAYLVANTIADYLNFALWAFVFILLPIGATYFKGGAGLLTSLLIIFITSQQWIQFFRHYKNPWTNWGDD